MEQQLCADIIDASNNLPGLEEMVLRMDPKLMKNGKCKDAVEEVWKAHNKHV